MEKQQDMTLMKARSYRSVLSTGFKLYTENFRRLFKASWPMALLYALCCGAVGTLINMKLPEITIAFLQQIAYYQGLLMETAQHYAVSFTEIFVLTLLAIAALSVGSATILNKLKEHAETGTITIPMSWWKVSPKMMLRTLKGVFLTLLVGLLPLLLFAGVILLVNMVSPGFLVQHLISTISAIGIYAGLVMLLELPLLYILMKYVMEEPQHYWQTLGKGFGKGLRYWGSLFLVFFVSILLVELASLVIMMPSHILNIANQQAHLGVLMGDPLGMPSYILPLTFGTATLASFIQFYICQITLVHNYYIYGAIETKEQESEKNKKNIQ